MDHSSVRLWFVSDIHASNTCFRKFLNLPRTEAAPNVIIIGGDITGKHLVPIVERGGNQFTVHLPDRTQTITGQELSETKTGLENSGCYVYECNPAAFTQLTLN